MTSGEKGRASDAASALYTAGTLYTPPDCTTGGRAKS